MKAATLALPMAFGFGLITLLATQGTGAATADPERLLSDSPAVAVQAQGASEQVAPGATHTRIYVEIVPQSLDDYLRGSDEILRGTVLEQRAVFPEVGVPYTEVEFRIDSVVQGTPQAPDTERVIHVRVGGAWSAERVVDVLGAPRFTPGDEAVLFLVRYFDPSTERDYYGIRGLWDGTYRVRPDERGLPVVRGLLARGERDLDAFEARLRETRSAVIERGEEPR